MISKKRLWKTSHAALAAAASLVSTAIYAQDAGPAAPPAGEKAEEVGDTIVVTGTSIKGVTPIGSNVMSVGTDELEKTSATNLSTLVNTIPALTRASAGASGEIRGSSCTSSPSPCPVPWPKASPSP